LKLTQQQQPSVIPLSGVGYLKLTQLIIFFKNRAQTLNNHYFVTEGV